MYKTAMHFIINQNVLYIKLTTNLKCIIKNINKNYIEHTQKNVVLSLSLNFSEMQLLKSFRYLFFFCIVV